MNDLELVRALCSGDNATVLDSEGVFALVVEYPLADSLGKKRGAQGGDSVQGVAGDAPTSKTDGTTLSRVAPGADLPSAHGGDWSSTASRRVSGRRYGRTDQPASMRGATLAARF